MEGLNDGDADGAFVGKKLGLSVGVNDGRLLGDRECCCDGGDVSASEGGEDGSNEGISLASFVGRVESLFVGTDEGEGEEASGHGTPQEIGHLVLASAICDSVNDQIQGSLSQLLSKRSQPIFSFIGLR